MKKLRKILLVLILMLVVVPFNVKADEKVINIYLFYGDGCPHCAAEEEFLSDYLKDRTDVKLYKYEVWYDSHNQELLSKVQKEMGTTNKNGVPFTVIGKKTIYLPSFLIFSFNTCSIPTAESTTLLIFSYLSNFSSLSFSSLISSIENFKSSISFSKL